MPKVAFEIAVIATKADNSLIKTQAAERLHVINNWVKLGNIDLNLLSSPSLSTRQNKKLPRRIVHIKMQAAIIADLKSIGLFN